MPCDSSATAGLRTIGRAEVSMIYNPAVPKGSFVLYAVAGGKG